MMKRICRLIVTAALLALLGISTAQAADKDLKPESKVMKFKKGDVFIINELGSIITADDERLIVLMAGNEEQRNEQYQDVDLKANDRIFMLNGKRVEKIKDLEDGYLLLNDSENVELGVKREGKMKIVSFPKEAADKLPKMHVITQSESGSINSIQSDGRNMNIEYTDSEGSGGLIPVIEAGLIIAERKDQVVVKMLLPNGEEMMGKGKLLENDIILSLQGKKVSSSREFSDIFSNISDGVMVKIEYSRDGEVKSVSFEKQAVKGNINVNIKN